MQSTFWHVVTLAAAVFLFGLAPAAAAQPARAGHADTEQEIRAVRAVYQEVTQAIAANRLTRTEKTVRCHNDDLGGDVTVWTDAPRVVCGSSRLRPEPTITWKRTASTTTPPAASGSSSLRVAP